MQARCLISVDRYTVAVFARDSATGALAQLPGEAGCLSDPGPGHDPACGTAGPLDRAYGVAVAPDGRHVYVAARDADAVTAFARDDATGALSLVGCVADPGSPAAPECDLAPGLDGPVAIAVAPDGGSLLVAAWDGSAVVALARDPSNGRLAATACVIDRSVTTLTACTSGDGLQYASSVAISPDGRSVYVTGPGSSAVAWFARDPATGTLTQLGCVSGDGVYRQDPDCGSARAIQYAQHVAVSPDGAQVIVAATDSHALILFARDPATGALTQLPGVDGCVSDVTDGPTYCRPGLGLALPLGIAFSPDSRYVFTGSFGYGSVAAFERSPASGLLSQAGPCISQHDVDCRPGKQLERAGFVTASPDGRNVYVNAPDSSAVLTFAVGHKVLLPAARVRAQETTVELSCPTNAATGCLGTIQNASERWGLRRPWSKPVRFDLGAGESGEFALPALEIGTTGIAIRVTAIDPADNNRVFVRLFPISQ